MVQEVRRRVVGHKHIHPPVIVVVGEDDAEPVAAMLADAGLLADVGKRAVVVVVVEDGRKGSEVERVTVDADPRGGVAAEDVVVEAGVDVVDDEEIEIAVAIDVRKGAAGGETIASRRPRCASRRRTSLPPLL